MPDSTQITYRKSSWWKLNQQRLTPWFFLFPGLLLFLVYVIWPIFNSLYISLLQWDGLSPAIYVGLSNYIELLDDEYFYISLMNNLKWLILFMLAVPIGLGLAIFLNQTIFGIRLIKSLFFFILADENFATYGIIFAGIYPQIAYCMILYLTGLNNLNTDQIEAGRMDGAKGFSLFKNIILPQLKPATFLAIVVTVIGSLRSFDMVAIMTQGGPYGSTNVLAYYMFETALSEYGYRMGYGSAIAAVLFTIMMFYILFFIYRMYQSEKKGL